MPGQCWWGASASSDTVPFNDRPFCIHGTHFRERCDFCREEIERYIQDSKNPPPRPKVWDGNAVNERALEILDDEIPF